MKKIFVGVIAAGLSLAAFAGPVQAAGHGDSKGIECRAGWVWVGNPAGLFDYYSDRGNPVDQIGESATGWTVGEWIQNRCYTPGT